MILFAEQTDDRSLIVFRLNEKSFWNKGYSVTNVIEVYKHNDVWMTALTRGLYSNPGYMCLDREEAANKAIQLLGKSIKEIYEI